MGQEIARFLITTIVDLYTLVIVLRLLLQLVKADFYNPISQFIVRATTPGLKPLRRIIPGLWGFDFAALILACIVQAVGWVCLFLLVDGQLISNPVAYIILSLFGVAKVTLNFYFFAVIILVIVSWVAPGNYNPAVALLSQLTEPIMRPVRKLLPSLGGLDLSPMIVLFILHILSNIVLPGLLASLAGR
jgi:YggT family protein